MNPTSQLQKTNEERAVEFVPFGSADKIKLSVKIIQNMVAVPTAQGRTCSERDALRFLMLCQAQRLNPFAGDAFLIGYDGKNGPVFSLITAHQAFLKRAETSPDFEGMDSGVIIVKEDGEITEREGDFHLENEQVIGGWARVHRKGRRDTYRRLRMARFNNGYAQWKVDPAGMIVKCAEADALRSTFPTLLGGLYMQGEIDDATDRIVTSIAKQQPAFEARTLVESVAAPVAEAQNVQDKGDTSNPELMPKPEAGAQAGAVAELQNLVLSSGFTFAHLQNWGMQTGNLDGADSLGSFEEISEKNAVRLLRAKVGLLRGLAQVKEGKSVE